MSTGWFNIRCIINMPIWYISILFQCYIIAFVFVKIISRHKYSQYILAIPVIFNLSIEYSGLVNSNILLINGYSSRGIRAFFVGIILVIILEKYNREIEKHCRILLACAYMILLSIYLLYKGFGEGIFGNVFMKFTNPVRYDIDIYLDFL